MQAIIKFEIFYINLKYFSCIDLRLHETISDGTFQLSLAISTPVALLPGGHLL